MLLYLVIVKATDKVKPLYYLLAVCLTVVHPVILSTLVFLVGIYLVRRQVRHLLLWSTTNQKGKISCVLFRKISIAFGASKKLSTLANSKQIGLKVLLRSLPQNNNIQTMNLLFNKQKT